MSRADYSKLTRTELMSLLTDRNVEIPQQRVLSREELVSLAVANPGRTSQAVPHTHSRSPMRTQPQVAHTRNVDISPMRKRQIDTRSLSKALEASSVASSASDEGCYSYNCLLKLLLVLLLAYFAQPLLDYYSQREVVFCSKDVVLQNCTPCPEHADCAQGKAECRRPYIREGDLCLENKVLVYMMHTKRREVESIVMEKSAEMYVKSRDQYRVTLQDVRHMLAGETDNEVWRMLEDYLRSPSYHGVLNVTDTHYSVILSVSEPSLSFFQE